MCAKIVTRWVGCYTKRGQESNLDRSSHSHRLHQLIKRQYLRDGRHVTSPAPVWQAPCIAGQRIVGQREPCAPQGQPVLALAPRTSLTMSRHECENPGLWTHLRIKMLMRFNGVGHRFSGDHNGHSNSPVVGWDNFMFVSMISPTLALPITSPTKRQQLPAASSMPQRSQYGPTFVTGTTRIVA